MLKPLLLSMSVLTFSGYDEALAVLESRLTDQSRILDTVEDSLRNETECYASPEPTYARKH